MALEQIYVPREQRLQGLKFVLNKIPLSIFIRSLKLLVHARFISKSEMHRIIKDARHILGISYDDYKNMVAKTNSRK